MGRPAFILDPFTKHVLANVSFGKITKAEAAVMLGRSRARVTQLCRLLNIDAKAARERYLERALAGTRLPQTKAQMSAQDERLVRRFLAQN